MSDVLDEYLPKAPRHEETTWTPPDPVVTMIEYHGRVLVATTKMIYIKGDDDVMRPLRFARADDPDPDA